jgi:hypothetical protein
MTLVRARSIRHRKPLILGGHERSGPACQNRRSHRLHRHDLGRHCSTGRPQVARSATASPPDSCHEAAVTEDEPHPTIRVEPTARPGTRRPSRRPCHKRAIHSSPERSRADNHGQPRSRLDLRRSPSSQVTAAPDLALGAGGRLPSLIGLALQHQTHRRSDTGRTPIAPPSTIRRWFMPLKINAERLTIT